MIAKELIKKENEYNTFDGIIKRAKECNEDGGQAIFVGNWQYISEDTKLRLLKEGFSLRIGDWDGVMKNVLIIEW